MPVLLTIIAVCFFLFGSWAMLSVRHTDITIIAVILCFGFGGMIAALAYVCGRLAPEPEPQPELEPQDHEPATPTLDRVRW